MILDSFRRFRPLLLPTAWFGAGLGALLAIDAPVTRSAYCPDCGLRRDERQVRLAGLPLPFRALPREAPSHLSELLRSAGVDRSHGHRWRPAECPVLRTEVGSPAGQAVLAEVRTPRLISFVRELEQFADRPTVARWHAYLANASFLRLLDGRLRFLRFPEEGWTSREAFMKWWSEHSYALYREIEITPLICC